MHREHEYWPEDFNEQEERRVSGAIGHTSGFEKDEKGGVRRAEYELDDAGFQAASVNQSVEQIRESCKTVKQDRKYA